eukprot:6790198-Pyramimonas_sp.AAC.1
MVRGRNSGQKLGMQRSSFKSPELYDLLLQMLDDDPLARPSAHSISTKSWLKSFCLQDHAEFDELIASRLESHSFDDGNSCAAGRWAARVPRETRNYATTSY